MAESLGFFLKKGAVDSLLQVAATTGVRFALVLAIFVLAAFLPAEQIATYDLFVVASSIFLILVTLGLDSGLCLAALTRKPARQAAYLYGSLLLSLFLSLVLYFPLRAMVDLLDLGAVFDRRVFTIAYCYAALNALIVLIFSFYRWLGRAAVASLLVVLANAVGFAVAFLLFALHRTVEAFTQGLVVGAGVGFMLCLLFALRDRPPVRSMFAPRLRWRILRQLVRISLPFGFGSGSLMARRAVDRAVILALGDPALLGTYALVTRFGEVVAFAASLPSVGFSPLLVREHAQAAATRVARWLYSGFVGFTLIAVSAAGLAWLLLGPAAFPADVRGIAFLFVPMLAANLFLMESTVAGYGFVIRRRTMSVAALSLGFILLYVVVTLPLLALGAGIASVGAGFLAAALVHSILFIWLSEQQVRFGYPLGMILAAKMLIFVIALACLVAPVPGAAG